MEAFTVAIISCSGAVKAFNLPNFELKSAVDVSDQSITDSLVNSSINSFEFSLNLSSLTLFSVFLVLLLVIYLFTNLSQAVLILNSKVNQRSIAQV